MIIRNRAPVSNRERQRQFRKRNPGYFRKYSARHGARLKAAKELVKAELAAIARAEIATVNREPLMLSAPVETIQIPGMNMIEATRAREEVPELRQG